VFFLTFSLASFLAPALGGASFQYLGAYHWLAVAGLGLLGAAGHLAASGPRERRVAETSMMDGQIAWRRAGDADPYDRVKPRTPPVPGGVPRASPNATRHRS
jgi:hypothetical protein